MNVWKALSLGMFLLGWFERASKDGQITPQEIAEGVIGAIAELKLDLKVDLGDLNDRL